MTVTGVAWGVYSLRGQTSRQPLASTAQNFLFVLPWALAINLLLVGGVHITPRGLALAAVSGTLTSALGYVVWGVAHRWASFTGGDNGVTNVPFPAVGGWGITSHTQYYYFTLAVILLCCLGYRVLVRSPFGLGLRGIKASETRMRSLGYRTGLHLYAAFVLSAFIASLAGVLYVYYNRFVNPVASSFPVSVEAVLMAIVGGTGTIVGPFIGAGVVLGLRNWVSSFVEMHHAIMGAVFIATVLWAPDGLVGLAGRLRNRFFDRGRAA